MKWSTFKKDYLIRGKAYDVDKVAGVQCVDLPKLYVNKCFGVPTGKGQAVWGDAADWWRLPAPLNPYFYRIPNTPDFVPMEADITIWGAGYSENHDFGHIAIATGDGNRDYFMVFEQNRMGNHNPVSIGKQTYRKDFKGVLRPFRVVKKAVNIRSLPSSKSDYLGELSKGNRVRVDGISEDGKWLHTQYGWCNNNKGYFFYEIGEK